MLVVLGHLTPYVLVTAVFTFLYGFVPNTQRAAPRGAHRRLFAGVVWARPA